MRVFLSVIVAALLAYGIGFVLFVSNLPPELATHPKADGIVVLTGGDERLETAVAMLERGTAKRLLVSGTAVSVTKETVGKISGGGKRFDKPRDDWREHRPREDRKPAAIDPNSPWAALAALRNPKAE